MPGEDITGSVEGIEAEAEKTLEDAHKQAAEIIREAKEEASKIADAEVSLDNIEEEREQILAEARERADKSLEEAKKQAAGIRDTAGRKKDKSIKRIVNIISGAASK